MVQYDDDDYLDYDSADDVVVTGDAIADVMEGLAERCNDVSKDEIASALEATTSIEKAIEWLFINILDQELVIDLTDHILKNLGVNKKFVTKDEVKSSLYYYYYDLDKTEAYFKKKIETATKKEMAEGKIPQTAAPTTKLKSEALKKQGNSVVKKAVDTQVQPTDENPGFTVKSFKVPQSKKLNVPELHKHRVENEKRSISFVVAGHVDAGKSTLMGRLLLETGVIDDHTVRKLEKDAAESGKKSFGLAWVLDSREEEREHGVTIDIATRFFETEHTKFTILDAPGHRDFVPNMISGASLADFAVLVVDASTNAFERGLKGQTLEHVLLLRSLGVQRVIIAVNKLEMVGWAQERYEEITSAMTAFMLNLNFPRKMVTFLPLSGIDGINLVKPPTNLSSLDWYKGPTLIQALEETESAERQLGLPARMEVADIFTSLHSGLTISGRLQTGTLQVGDLMVVSTETQPKFYIKSLLVGEEPRDWAAAGELVDLVVVGVDPAEIRTGDVVSISTDPVQLMTKLTMRVLAFETFMSCNVDIHRGTNHSAGCITNILATLDKSTGVNQVLNPFVVKQSTMARVKLILREPIAVARGQRVVIRREGRTIAAGVIEE